MSDQAPKAPENQPERPAAVEQPAAGKPSDGQPQKAPKAEKAPKGEKQGGKGEKQQAAKGGKGEKQGKGQAAEKPTAKEKEPSVPDKPPGYVPRLKKLYLETVAGALKEEFAYSSPMQVPRLGKIVVSIGLGEAITNKKLLDTAGQELGQITGQKPVRTKAKKSIANFKVRKGMEIGVMVTLRGDRMYEFLDRLVNVAMPRIKDFRGVNPNSFDGRGNYALGVTEQIIFPEIDYDKIERVSGMNIAIATTARTDAEGRSLLARLGMPFRR